MGRKVFVSYKYKDNDVKELPNVTQPTWPCDYVDYIRNNVLKDDDIYKGENSDEDISAWSEEMLVGLLFSATQSSAGQLSHDYLSPMGGHRSKR